MPHNETPYSLRYFQRRDVTPHWYRPAQMPPHNVVVIAEAEMGLDGIAAIEAMHCGIGWCRPGGALLPDAVRIRRWRFKDVRIDGAGSPAPDLNGAGV